MWISMALLPLLGTGIWLWLSRSMYHSKRPVLENQPV
jgi:hypothetical protein